MQKNLLRQLKRSIGVDSESRLSELLASMEAAVATSNPALHGVLRGFGDLLAKVDASYEQYERDIDLRTRSLALSSSELSDSNEQLRQELARRQEALGALRAALNDLLPGGDELASADALAEDNIATLSRRIAELVAESEHGRRELANQKFALDQHAIVSITDPGGNILYANDRFCEISGFSRDELIGKNHRIVNSGTHPAELFRDMWQTIAGGQVWRGEICNRAHDGHLYWVSATIVPLLGDGGAPEQYIAIRTDITDRKRMETQLSEQLHLVEELLEAIPLPVYLKDTFGRYIRLNRAFELFFHVRRENYIGRTLHDLLSPEDARVHAEKDTELFAAKGTQSYETVVHSRDGENHDAIYRKAVLTHRDGSVSGLLGVIVDITDRKKAEREVMRAKETAEAASRAKSDFLANMSHEIRTPMNGVIGMTDLALDTELTVEQREYLSIAKSSAESLLTVINDVPRFVQGDPSRIRQVLVNLLGNAIKFTDAGEIALTTELMQRQHGRAIIHFAVRDTGIGIADDKQDLIFDAFSQEDTSTTRKYGGTGLGLSICRRLVELMGGRIWLHSQLGRGSTFHFSIELQLAEHSISAPPRQVDLLGKHIFIVDDNATNRRILCNMLANRHASTTDADSGPAALAMLRQDKTKYDCILLDAQMPGMDGYELARRLKQEHPDLPPMLMLSSGSLRGDAQRCQEAGIAGFFSKPISADELLAALGQALDTTAKPLPAPAQLITRHSLREARPVLNILLVEDHPTNQKLALGLLEKWGHLATLAKNGQEAIDILEWRSFDVILMDMQMPIMGGVEATEHIRAREARLQLPRTPIIAMTAAAMQDDRDACLAAGMDDYLSKPIKVRELQEKLHTYCRSS